MKTIRKIKFKYYSRQVLKYLLWSSVIVASGAATMLAWQIFKRAVRDQGLGPRVDPLVKKKSKNTFYYLLRRGLIEMKRQNHDVAIALTKEGKQRAGKYQIDDLELKVPSKWDGKWRVVIFDIPSVSNLVRNVFRRKLKEWGFYPVQKSIWVYPYDCGEEIEFLREFLGASQQQIQVLEVSKMEDDRFLRKIFSV